jgi:replicative DNA helicase
LDKKTGENRKPTAALPTGVVPPSNQEAEQAVLGAILVRPQVLDDVADLLTVDDFYRTAHGVIYDAITTLYNKKEPVDLVTVTALLRERGQLDGVGGPLFLAGLSEQVGFATNAEHYAKIVRDKATVRRLLEASQTIAQACLAPVEDTEALLNAAETSIMGVTMTKQIQAQSLAELVPVEEARLESIYNHRGELTGVPSGFVDLDRHTGGFQPSDLIIIAARPSMGKTALALNIAQNAAGAYGVPSAFFSLEMSKEQLTQRLISSTAQVDHSQMKRGLIRGVEWSRIKVACGDLISTPIYICDKAAMTPGEIRAQARRLRMKYGIGMVIVDYLQLAHDPKARSREQEVSAISRAMKALAKELHIPVIALSQLNRQLESRDNKRPQLADLRESGAIEQDSDLVMFIYRDEVYHKETTQKGIAELAIAKHRNGPTGLVKLSYLPEYISFKNHEYEKKAA